MSLEIPRELGIDGSASLSHDGLKARVTLVGRRAEQDSVASLIVRGADRVLAATLSSLSARDLTPDVPLDERKDWLEPKDGRLFEVPVQRYGVVLLEIPLEGRDQSSLPAEKQPDPDSRKGSPRVASPSSHG